MHTRTDTVDHGPEGRRDQRLIRLWRSRVLMTGTNREQAAVCQVSQRLQSSGGKWLCVSVVGGDDGGPINDLGADKSSQNIVLKDRCGNPTCPV